MSLFSKVLKAWITLRYQHVIRQGGQFLIAQEFFASIIGFGRWRQHFNDESRVDQHVLLRIVERRLSTHDDQIGIGEKPPPSLCGSWGREAADLHVSRERPAGSAAELSRNDFTHIDTMRLACQDDYTSGVVGMG